MPDVKKSQAQWSDQDYLNHYTIALYLVTAQGDQQSQIDEGRRALSVVMSPDNSSFNSVYNMIGTTGPLQNVYEAGTSPYSGKELKNGIYGEYQVGGEGGRLVLANYLGDDGGRGPKAQYMLFLNRSDDKGNVVPILADSFLPGDRKLGLFPK